TEKNLLDFGCGPGRFTSDLAQIINGKAIGFDPTKGLIDLCKATPNTQFTYVYNFSDSQILFDVIWICLVLGGLSNEQLAFTVKKLEKVLARHGLIFLIESTSKNQTKGCWKTRTVEYYQNLFHSIPLKKIGEYFDANQEISIFAGRKKHIHI
ncbi:MAG: class I SAM-dependent methyltransferase, partial [bacterium]